MGGCAGLLVAVIPLAVAAAPTASTLVLPPVLHNRSKSLANLLQQREVFARDGILHLQQFLSQEMVDYTNRYLDEVVWGEDLERRPDMKVTVTVPGTYDASMEVDLVNATRDLKSMTYRLNGAHLPDLPNPVRAILYDPFLITVARRLMGGPAEHVMSIWFERGSQQALHDDCWYRLGSNLPGGTVGVWVALDDVDADNGPLFYLAGSHRRPEVPLSPKAVDRYEMLSVSKEEFSFGKGRMEELRDEAFQEARKAGFKEKEIRVRKGDLVFWQERLLHGGRPILDPNRTRRSVAGHYICCRSGEWWREEALRRKRVLESEGSTSLADATLPAVMAEMPADLEQAIREWAERKAQREATV